MRFVPEKPRTDLIPSVKRYAAVHHLPVLVAGFTLLVAFDVQFGSSVLSLPFERGGQADGLPMRRELPVAFAALAAGSLHSSMHQLELTAGPTLRTYEKFHLLGLYLTTLILVGGIEWFETGPEQAITACRSLIIWLGLALLSGRLWGRWLSWILPAATLFPLTYLNRNANGNAHWWDWTGQSASHAPCWAIALLSTAIGLPAFFLTSWQWRTLRTRS